MLHHIGLTRPVLARPNTSIRCINHKRSLLFCCKKTTHLDETLAVDHEAVVLCFQGRSDGATSRQILADALQVRENLTDDGILLDNSIEIDREVFNVQLPSYCGQGPTNGNAALLKEAITCDLDVLALHPPGYQDRGPHCHSLAVSLRRRYERAGDPTLLDKAIELDREALALLNPCHADRKSLCGDLGHALYMRYEQTGNLALLDDAIQLQRQSLDLQPRGRLECRAHASMALAGSLVACYRKRVDIRELDEAIGLYQSARECFPASETWRSLTQLSQLHLIPTSPYFSIFQALQYLLQTLLRKDSNTAGFMQAVRDNVSSLWQFKSEWSPQTIDMLVDVYSNVVDRLPFVADFALGTSCQLHVLKSTRTIGSEACIAALLSDQPSKAVELLDRGHAVVWTQALHLRDPQMEGAPPPLATELAYLLRQISAPPPSQQKNPSDPLQTTEGVRHKQNSRIQTILREIRAMPGLDRFMLGSAYGTLREAAREHPIVMLVTAYDHSFALIVSNAASERPYTLRLDLTSHDLLWLQGSAEQAGIRRSADTRDVKENVIRGMYKSSSVRAKQTPLRVLAELWRKIVKPVLDYFQLEVRTGRLRPRLHWCPNGDLAFLPLHAAGIYYGPQEHQVCCSDYVVSSYTPTISALLRAQAQAVPVASTDLTMLLVGEDCTNSLTMTRLPNVQKELKCIESIAEAKQFGHVEVMGEAAAVEQVTDRIKSVSFLHLACHGIQHRTNALESGFYLSNGVLTISKLMELKLNRPWFAYLSACETAKCDAEQPDQVMHLAAAMLFAGFKSVVATMWLVGLGQESQARVEVDDDSRAMNDADGPDMARWFYEEVMASKTIDTSTIAYALDGAVQKLRAKVPSPQRWAQFIHMGA